MLSIRLARQGLRSRVLQSFLLFVPISIIGCSFLVNGQTVKAVQPIVFPVLGQSSYSNDFDAPRGSGKHNAIDIIAGKHQPIVAAMSGTISFVAYPEPSWGYAVFIDGDDGFEYNYIHMNNDNPGTDDGRGGPMRAYAPDIQRGNKVVKGQLIGWVGDSGNAENTVSHLHFEMVHPDGYNVNPYASLNAAQRITSPKDYPALSGEILPYGSQARVSTNLAVGNLDGDQDEEIVIGAGPGSAGPQIKISNQNGPTLAAFNTFDSTYRNGVDVAVGDVNGDGVNEVITSSGPNSTPTIRVLNANGVALASFSPYSERTGTSITSGDVDGDGTDEIIAGARTGSDSNIKIFKVSGSSATEVSSFYAYLSSFKGGVDVAAANVNDDSKDEIIVAPIAKAGSDIRTYNQTGQQLGRFFAFDPSYTRGVRIAAGDVYTASAKAEILVVPVDSTAHLVVFDSAGKTLQDSWFLEEWWRSTSFDVAAGQGEAVGSAGINRRTTVRTSIELAG